MKTMLLAGVTTVLALTAPGALADSGRAGDWLVRVGYHTVDPKSNNGSVLGGSDNIQVAQATALTFNVSYFFTDAIALELQAATPFKHDVNLVDVGKVASVKELPPTLNVQYHFDVGAFKPYLGAGLNWTIFYDENTSGALAGTDLKLDNSLGVDVQAGVDYAIGNDWYLNAEIRWIDIDSDADVNGGPLTTLDLDPLAYALSVGRSF